MSGVSLTADNSPAFSMRELRACGTLSAPPAGGIIDRTAAACRHLRILFAALILLAYPALSFAQDAGQQSDLTLHWEKNILSIVSPRLPQGVVEIWYLEAFCRSGSTQRVWNQTVIPHQTRLVHAQENGKALELESVVGGQARVRQLIRVVPDGVDFRMTLTNPARQALDIEWGQPCVRVQKFTGLTQEAYIRKCFLFTEHGRTMLDRTRRTEEALYRGGQVYVPKGVDPADVNPRALSPDVPVNGLIGCFSGNGQYLLATAWEPTQELFQGVIVCIHSDFRVGGLAAQETKQVHGKIYFLENDTNKLLEHYRADFGH